MIGQETMFTCLAAADEVVVFRLGCEIAPEAKRQSPSLREKEHVSGGLKKRKENPQPIVCSSVRDSLTLKSGIELSSCLQSSSKSFPQFSSRLQMMFLSVTQSCAPPVSDTLVTSRGQHPEESDRGTALLLSNADSADHTFSIRSGCKDVFQRPRLLTP